jgi:hypothetical protein
VSARTSIVIDAPYAKLHVTSDEVSDHAYMRARQLEELLFLMQPEEGPDTALWLAQQMANEVVASIAGMIGVKA